MEFAFADVLRGALAFFLVVIGVGIAYACFRLGGMFANMSVSVRRVTDELVPILSRAQTTVDGINLELQRVDEIMVSAVAATKGAEKTVTSLSGAVTSPVKKASGWAAAAKEAMATFRARRAATRQETAPAAASTGTFAGAETPAEDSRSAAEASPPASHGSESSALPSNGGGSSDDVPPEVRDRSRGPSLSQISWALPKRRG